MQDKLIWILIGVVSLCVTVLAAAAVIVSLSVPSAPEPQPSATSEGLALAVPYEVYSGCVDGIYDATGTVSEADHYDCADGTHDGR